jgi:hypothetical protein
MRLAWLACRSRSRWCSISSLATRRMLSLPSPCSRGAKYLVAKPPAPASLVAGNFHCQETEAELCSTSLIHLVCDDGQGWFGGEGCGGSRTGGAGSSGSATAAPPTPPRGSASSGRPIWSSGTTTADTTPTVGTIALPLPLCTLPSSFDQCRPISNLFSLCA